LANVMMPRTNAPRVLSKLDIVCPFMLAGGPSRREAGEYPHFPGGKGSICQPNDGSGGPAPVSPSKVIRQASQSQYRKTIAWHDFRSNCQIQHHGLEGVSDHQGRSSAYERGFTIERPLQDGVTILRILRFRRFGDARTAHDTTDENSSDNLQFYMDQQRLKGNGIPSVGVLTAGFGNHPECKGGISR
jgi:hypothetical protein